MNDIKNIKLTQYSHGAGCGCKISPKVLSSILQTEQTLILDDKLLVGNDSRDDAAVYDLGDGTAVISTTDFFMPIVDDPFTFGKIAATNAISDIYAMGGAPLMAIAILGWPINKLAPEIAQQVLEGGRSVCAEAKIPLAGGHSIDSPEPIFGLAVTGRVSVNKVKKNNSAKAGDKLFLTKPIGVGVLTTAQKQGKLLPEHSEIAPESMCKLNSIGKELSEFESVSAMTDVTGFGLLGHLLELCEGSNLSAKVEFDKIPLFEPVGYYIENGAIPGGTHRNWDSFGTKVKLRSDDDKLILCDPQTSGGLLIAVSPSDENRVIELLKQNDMPYQSIGELVTECSPTIEII